MNQTAILADARTVAVLARADRALAKYAPGQPRDERGRFASTGSGGGGVPKLGGRLYAGRILEDIGQQKTFNEIFGEAPAAGGTGGRGQPGMAGKLVGEPHWDDLTQGDRLKWAGERLAQLDDQAKSTDDQKVRAQSEAQIQRLSDMQAKNPKGFQQSMQDWYTRHHMAQNPDQYEDEDESAQEAREAMSGPSLGRPYGEETSAAANARRHQEAWERSKQGQQGRSSQAGANVGLNLDPAPEGWRKKVADVAKQVAAVATTVRDILSIADAFRGGTKEGEPPSTLGRLSRTSQAAISASAAARIAATARDAPTLTEAAKSAAVALKTLQNELPHLRDTAVSQVDPLRAGAGHVGRGIQSRFDSAQQKMAALQDQLQRSELGIRASRRAFEMTGGRIVPAPPERGPSLTMPKPYRSPDMIVHTGPRYRPPS